MAKRKERSLEELYKLHGKLAKPRVTPILEGTCHMQGPADELDSETETDLENNRGGKILIGFSSDKMDTCMETISVLECESHVKNSIIDHGDSTFCNASNGMRRGKEADESITTNLFTIDAIERKETLVSHKEKEPDNVNKATTVITKMGDFAGTGLECDIKIEKGESGHMVEESESVVKGVYSPQSYYKGKLILHGEETQENHEKCSTSEELQISHDVSLPCESVQGFILGSKGAPQLADLDAREFCVNLESVMRVDLTLEVPSRKDNDGNEIDRFRDTGAADALSKKDPNMLLGVLESTADQRNQPENKSMQLSGETFCMSPGSHLGTQLPSTERKERISEIYTKSELCNAEYEKRNMVFGELNTGEKEYYLTERFTKLAENVADQSHAHLEGETSTVRKKVNSSGTECFSDVSDEVKPLSIHETLDPQYHNMPKISANSNVATTDACVNPNLTDLRSITECKKLTSGQLEVHAIGSPLQKETQKRYIIKGNISQEMVSSPISGLSDRFSVNVIMPTKDCEPHSGCKQDTSFVPPCSTDQMNIPTSKQLVVSTIQENLVSVSNPFSDVHSVKHSMDGCVGSDLVPGLLIMESLQPLAEPNKPVNVLPVDVSPDKMDAGNQMDLDENLERDKMDVEPSEMKGASVAFAPVFEDHLLEDDVKVCDICGDAGREDMLAICSKCNDGAEHIYCMRIMLDKVPEGNWLCEGCKSTQNTTLKKAERTQILMSKPDSLSSKKQSSNESSHSRPSDKAEKKKSDPEIMRIIGTSSSQSPTKRRAETLDIGPATKKQAVEVRSVQQGVSSSNAKQVLSREKSFKSTDFVRTKSSVSGAFSGNHLSSGLHNIGKSSAAMGTQSPRLHAGMQSSKSRFTSVNSLTSDSLPTAASSNAVSCVLSALTDKAALSSKSADVRPSSSWASRLSNTPKLVTIPKNKKDFGDVGGKASLIRERSGSGVFGKVLNDSLLFKSKGSINASTVIEPRIFPNAQNASCLQTKETRIGKLRKDEADSMTRKSVLKSGNTVDDSKPAVNDTSVSQATLRRGLSRKDLCKSKPVVPEEKSLVIPSHVSANIIKEECSSTMCPGVSLPTLTTSPIMSKTGLVDIKSEPLASSEALCCSESQTYSEQGNSELTSGLKLMQVSGSFGFPTDGKGSSIPNETIVNIDSPSAQNSLNDDKPKNFASSRTRNFLPDVGSTRCYKCKELGHTAQFCANRSPVNTCNNSLRVSTLKFSAGKLSREMSWSSSGKWNNPLETIVPNYTVACENDQNSEQILLSSVGQELEGRGDSNLPGQPSANNDTLFSKDSAGVSGKLDGECYMSRELSLLNSGLVRDIFTGPTDLASGHSKDFVVNHSGTTVTLSGEVPSSMTLGKKHMKGSNNAQIYSSQKLYFDGDGSFLSPVDYCNFSATTTITVQPTESTVTAVRRNIACDLPIISNGNYPSKCMRVPLYQQSSQSETVKMAALPEHNFLWQGGFEVRSKGNPTSHFDGLQAHASTCAALKVLDAAKKFSSSILLEEVPRLSAWPMQFHYSHPKDENVALYFFAKDLESYERSYKKLREHMLKNDFALRANFDGVELLIFPSNQLPEKSWRWNRLLYLWGVFRERKANCIDSSAYSLERTHGRLSTNVITAGNWSSKIAARVLPSLPVAGFSEREDMDIDVEGGQEGSLAESTGLGRAKSQISPFSSPSSSQDEGKVKGSVVQNASDFVEQKLPSTQENDELPGEDKLSFKKLSPKLSSEFGLYSKASYLSKDKQKPLDTDDASAAVSLPFRQSVISQISSWRERANSACLGHILFGPSAVSSSSLERQDNSLDSSKIAHVSSHSQTNTEKEKNKLKDDENDRGRERAKELEYASFRSKDIGHKKEWKLRERENERERERNGEIVTERERDRRISSRRHEEYSSHESRLRRDSREDRRHHFSHSPTRHGSRSSFPSMRINNYDHHHYRMRSPDFDQNRHAQALSGVEVGGGSRRRDMVSPRGRSSDFLIDDKGHRKLKKSYSEIYVREICKDQDSGLKNSGGRSSSELNTCSQTQQVSDLSKSVQYSRSSSLEHILHDNQEYNPSFPKESQVTERFFFPESIDAESSEVLHNKSITEPKSPELTSDDQCIPSVEDLRGPPDLDVPNLELALGAKISSPKPGVRPLFVQLHDKSYTQQQPSSPTTSEDGSSLSLTLTFPLLQKEQAVKSVLKDGESLRDNDNADTSLLLFGGGVDSQGKKGSNLIAL